MKVRSEIPTAENTTNMDGFGTCEVGTTLENLKAAIGGETGASAKYAAFAEAAEAAGYTQIARLFRATSEAEQVHIAMEYKLVQAEDPEWAKPVADAPVVEACDLNLIAAANGEIYETSDMYPAFIKKAQEEGNDKAVRVFTRAKLAESVHAERYMEAYNNIDAADDDAYFLCPVCGYIEKGDDFEVCPICGAKKSAFKQF